MHQQSPPPAAAMQLQHGASGSFAELSAFMKEMLERDDRAKQEMLERDDRAKQEMEAKVEQAKREARADMDQLREQMTPPEQSPAISDDELAALQARFESLHAAQLLTDEELYASEDLCADFVELQASVLDGGVLTMDAIFRAVRHTPAALQVYKLVRLSGSMASDAAFARQLRRKFL